MAATVTNLAACVGGLSWCLMDYRFERKWSTVGFCSGVVAGLVAITPASGYVPAWAAVVIGLCAGMYLNSQHSVDTGKHSQASLSVFTLWHSSIHANGFCPHSGISCNLAVQLKYVIGADDALDIFAVHAVGGFVGELLTGIFAADYIAHLDGVTVIKGGWLNRNWIQLAIQLSDAVCSMTWSFVMTYIILMCMWLLGKYVPALRLRVDKDEEEQGVDDVEIGEFAYDYVERARDAKASGPDGVELDNVSQHTQEHEHDHSHEQAQSIADLSRPASALVHHDFKEASWNSREITQ